MLAETQLEPVIEEGDEENEEAAEEAAEAAAEAEKPEPIEISVPPRLDFIAM